jgi:thiamine biosynthesis protein ThiS
MTTIILNGENKQIENKTNITQLLQSLDLANKRVAVEINQQLIPRSDFASHTLNEHDKVEIVQAIGGGGDIF